MVWYFQYKHVLGSSAILIGTHEALHARPFFRINIDQYNNTAYRLWPYIIQPL